MAEIVIRPPGPDAPGYLRRIRESRRIQARLAEDGSAEALDEMLDFILEHAEVNVPDGVDPKDALLDLSQAEFDEVFGLMAGGRQNGVDPTNAE